MSRYIQEVTLNKPDDFVSFIMNDFIQKCGFKPFDWKGEQCYRCGDGFVEGYKFMKYTYHNGVFHIEAWLKGIIKKEADLNGFVAIAVKKPYKASIESLIKTLQQPLPNDSCQNTPNPQNVQIPVQGVDQSGSAIAGLTLGILSIVTVCIPLVAIVLGCLTFAISRMGLCSSKRNLAVAGRVCAVVGMCLGAVMWILNIIGFSLYYFI